ncbi:amino acid adenylation domain-containing protein [Pseudonocardia aurantiaca]|uniref:Amino acid adenylation domain-containing protein n=1 Tax=Pseudonocardia aurantiaca TaxID=75290 RepID=A0ABW4FP33_9PSEU
MTTAAATAGFTAISRWTLDPVPGIAEHETAIPGDLLAAVHRVADEQAVPFDAVLLAAHAKVLSAMSGEREIVTGYAAGEGARPMPCQVTTEPDTWLAVLLAAARSRQLGPADGNGEHGPSGSLFETVFEPSGPDPSGSDPVCAGDDLADGVVLQVGFPRRGGRLALRLRYRTDVLDGDAAARIAGYHLAALASITADPDAEHRRQSLLSAEELHVQLEGLDGPRRELPDLRVHELFEQRVAMHPDAVAAVHGDQQWTYRELNSRANRLGRALLARGLRREAVVTVVTERNLDWMASVLAIWKAGLTYLPLEPHFPPGRIGTAICRAESPLVLTERASTTTLDQALGTLSGVETLYVDTAYAEGHADGDLGVDVGADQLAYMLFTSGSTGEPKGAMCEHAGMLNHVYAKLADLGVREGEAIPQTGPQCFDISVWQLVGALLVGGRTLLVEQEVVLDVARLVDTLGEARASVLQVVPSYLDILLSYLEQHPRELPDLHCVCPTGDFLKKELVRRWFAAQPGTRLVNTYGLTETSDDAVHEIMYGVPNGAQIPLGLPIQNTTVYVVDVHLSPVPLGAPGLIVFSGVCAGRGYVNDPERTRRMFGDDPHRPGRRICRTGDYGRWRPDGKLDFLGRRDNQVKIRGFRIEIGDIENALLRVPGIRDGAVVVADGADRAKRLVAFYSGERAIEADVLRDRLTERLPEYMLPSAFRWRERLPLTPNGKIDSSTLTTLADQLEVTETDYEAPSTPTEKLLARAWAQVLGVPADQIGRRDHFFELGGSSLSAVKLVVALNRVVSLKDVTRHPVLADLADLMNSRPIDSNPERTSELIGSATEGNNERSLAIACRYA